MKKQHIQLSSEDRNALEELLSKGRVLASTYKRAVALTELDRGRTYIEVGELVNVSEQTVSKWAKKYKATGLALLQDRPRSGRPPLFDGVEQAKITALACSDPPEGYGRWNLRLLASKAVELELVDSISHVHVGNILKKTN